VRRAALIALLPLAAACGGAADKAGGRAAHGPADVRFADVPWSVDDAPPVADFMRRFARSPAATVRIRETDVWDGYAPDAEARLVRAVADGRVQLAWVGSRVLDTVGAPAFAVLSAPLLIDSYPLERAVLASPLAGRMLAALRPAGVVGLALFGDALRVPIAVRRPLRAPADWRGVGFGTYRSGVQEAAVRALGARPVEAIAAYRSAYVRAGRIGAFEMDLPRYLRDVGVSLARYVTANVALWPQFDVLIANPHWLASLTRDERNPLRSAAAAAARNSVPSAGSAAHYLAEACARGARVTEATPAQLAALRRRVAPVYRRLARDPRTAGYLRTIVALKRATPPAPPTPIPRGCLRRG
jgi:TRAP-type C4-dicarboxylate transport system substrate-binding protein